MSKPNYPNPPPGMYRRPFSVTTILTGVMNLFMKAGMMAILVYGVFYLFCAIIGVAIGSWIVDVFGLQEILQELLIDSPEQDVSFLIRLVENLIFLFITLILFGILKFLPDTVAARIGDNYENNRIETFGESLGYAASRSVDVFILVILLLSINIGLVAIGAILVYLAIYYAPPLAFLNIITFLLIMYVNIRLALAQALVVVEEMSPTDALYASWNRLENRFWTYFASSLLIGLITGAIDQTINGVVGGGLIFSNGLLFVLIAGVSTVLFAPVEIYTALAAIYGIRVEEFPNYISQVYPNPTHIQQNMYYQQQQYSEAVQSPQGEYPPPQNPDYHDPNNQNQ